MAQKREKFHTEEGWWMNNWALCLCLPVTAELAWTLKTQVYFQCRLNHTSLRWWNITRGCTAVLSIITRGKSCMHSQNFRQNCHRLKLTMELVFAVSVKNVTSWKFLLHVAMDKSGKKTQTKMDEKLKN